MLSLTARPPPPSPWPRWASQSRSWPLLRHRPDPRVRSLLIQRLAANPLATRASWTGCSVRASIRSSCRRSCWRGPRCGRGAVTAPVRTPSSSGARASFLDDPHPGVHSAAELLLRRWEGPEFLHAVRSRTAGSAGSQGRQRWHRAQRAHVRDPARPARVSDGMLPHEPAHYGDPISHYRKIDRSLMVATKEVTVEQFQAFKPNHRNDARYGDEPECAAIHVSWFARGGLLQLAEPAGRDRQEPVVLSRQPSAGHGRSPKATSSAPGFRLPTEAEWEYFCRAGTDTARPYGDRIELLPRYAWTWLNSGNRAMPPGRLLPNEFGLFDVLGNAWEWCQDGPAGHYDKAVTKFPPYPNGTKEPARRRPGAPEKIEAEDRARETWRILRGGAFSYAPDRARSAFRDWQPSSDEREYLGLRVVQDDFPTRERLTSRCFRSRMRRYLHHRRDAPSAARPTDDWSSMMDFQQCHQTAINAGGNGRIAVSVSLMRRSLGRGRSR